MSHLETTATIASENISINHDDLLFEYLISAVSLCSDEKDLVTRFGKNSRYFRYNGVKLTLPERRGVNKVTVYAAINLDNYETYTSDILQLAKEGVGVLIATNERAAIRLAVFMNYFNKHDARTNGLSHNGE